MSHNWQRNLCGTVQDMADEFRLMQHIANAHGGIDAIDGSLKDLKRLHKLLDICTVVKNPDDEGADIPEYPKEKWTFVGRMDNGRYLWRQQYGGQCWRDPETFWSVP